MGYAKFLKWVGEQGLKNKLLQKYYLKAWREAEKLGKPIIEKNFPGLLKKAQDFYKNYKIFEPKIVLKKPKTLGDALKTGKFTKVPTPPGLKPPGLKKSNIIPFPIPKKPPHLKADGGRIDKALPKRSRDI